MIHDRILRAFEALVDKFTERTRCHVQVRYRVVRAQGDRYDLQAVRKGEWPDLVPCAVMGGAAGYKANLALGSIVLVSFIEGDLTLPRITAFEEPGQPGFIPISIKISGDAGPVPAAARVGDTVQGFMAVGPITGTISGAPFTGVVAVPIQFVGTIQTGSTKVGIG